MINAREGRGLDADFAEEGFLGETILRARQRFAIGADGDAFVLDQVDGVDGDVFEFDGGDGDAGGR